MPVTYPVPKFKINNNNTLIATGFLFEKENGNKLGTFELDQIQKAGIEDIPVEEIVNSIRLFITENLHSNNILFNDSQLCCGVIHLMEYRTA